ncbi:hypothetical protein D3C73_538560 [compost metagenome]
MIFSSWMLSNIFFDPFSFNFFQTFNSSKIDTVFVIYITVGIAACYHFSAELLCFFNRIDRYVTRTGYNNSFTIEAFAFCFKHFSSEIYKTVASSFSTSQAAAISKSFTCKNACFVPANKTFVLTEHVADFSCAYTDVTSRYVCVRTDIFGQFCHEALCKFHNFVVGFTFRIEVGATFTAADWLASQRVFENLFETKELDDASINGWMETKSTFVRSDSAVELNAETTVYLNIALIVNPRYAESDQSFWLNDSFKNRIVAVFRVFREYWSEGVQYFFYSLVKFAFTWISLNNGLVNFVYVLLCCF